MKSRARRGTVLILSVLMIFLFIGILALIVDIGNARISQRQMQAAADYAALEGLRGRDNPFVDRREDAQLAVRNYFDDDLDTGTADAGGFTAGRSAVFTQLNPDPLNVQETMTGIDDYDDPILQLNDGTGSSATPNEPHGDMLAGTYDPAERHDEGYNPSNYYLRDDFVPHDPGAGGPEPPSFLVRMRRTMNATLLDDEAGVSSRGAAFQFTFGRAILRHVDFPHDPLIDGMNIHSTSIADAQPALSVGPHRPLNGLTPLIPGAASLALTRDYYNSLPTFPAADIAAVGLAGQLTSVAISPGVLRDGQIIRKTRLMAGVGPAATVLNVGSTIAFPPTTPFRVRVDGEVMLVTARTANTLTVTRGIDGTASTLHLNLATVSEFEVSTIGDPIRSAPFFLGAATFNSTEVFAPIFENIGAPGERIVGYGRVSITPFLGTSVFISRRPDHIGAANAMGATGVPIDPTLTTADVDQIFALRATINGPLRAPVLARSYGR